VSLDAQQSPSIPSRALERLRGLMPAVRAAVKTVRTLAALAAAAGLLLWLTLFAGWLQAPPPRPLASLLALALLMAAPAGAALAAWLLGQVLALPDRLRELPAQAAGAVRAEAPRRRVLGAAGLLWRLRGVFSSGSGLWLRAAGMARLAKFASPPMLIYMIASLVLCVPLIAAGVVVTAVSLVLRLA
jgi:hypothetical protein